jgi:hypothetical protein
MTRAMSRMVTACAFLVPFLAPFRDRVALAEGPVIDQDIAGDEADAEDEEEVPELTTDQLKLLYMISRWAMPHTLRLAHRQTRATLTSEAIFSCVMAGTPTVPPTQTRRKNGFAKSPCCA